MTTIVTILTEGFADWETACSTAWRRLLRGQGAYATPGGKPVTSTGGMKVTRTSRSRHRRQRAGRDRRLRRHDLADAGRAGSHRCAASRPRGREGHRRDLRRHGRNREDRPARQCRPHLKRRRLSRRDRLQGQVALSRRAARGCRQAHRHGGGDCAGQLHADIMQRSASATISSTTTSGCTPPSSTRRLARGDRRLAPASPDDEQRQCEHHEVDRQGHRRFAPCCVEADRQNLDHRKAERGERRQPGKDPGRCRKDDPEGAGNLGDADEADQPLRAPWAPTPSSARGPRSASSAWCSRQSRKTAPAAPGPPRSRSTTSSGPNAM